MQDGKKIKNNEVVILVVEDSRTQAERLRYILEKQDYNVYIVYDGDKALDYLQDHKVTMVISDIIMPEMDGYQLCKSIKTDERLQHIPVMLLTMLSDIEDIIKGLDCGADNFITKPYNEQFLLPRINDTLMNVELRKEHTTEMGIEIIFAGKKQFINSNRIQILDLLLSSYEGAVQKNRELEKANNELRKANETIKKLGGMIPICARCKKIRDDGGFWHQIEEYLREHADLEFTHGYCPECVKVLYPEFYDRLHHDEGEEKK
jgi:two-component system cell cycle response regulator